MSESNGNYLRFQTNVPEEFTIAWNAAGMLAEHVEGDYGPQVKYRLSDGRLAYVPAHVGQKITALSLQRDEPVVVEKAEVKRGNRRGMEWQVKRVIPAPPATADAAPATSNGAGSNAPSNGSANGGVPYKVTKVNYTDAMRRCLIAAIDAAHAGEKHAADVGLAVQFSSTDIQDMATTLFIQASREGWIEYANGGSR
jgi:hypothetical protein